MDKPFQEIYEDSSSTQDDEICQNCCYFVQPDSKSLNQNGECHLLPMTLFKSPHDFCGCFNIGIDEDF